MPTVSRAPRTTLTAFHKDVMVGLRRKGFTLQFIAEMCQVSIGCVYQNTKQVPCKTRQKGKLVIDRRTGAFLKMKAY